MPRILLFSLLVVASMAVCESAMGQAPNDSFGDLKAETFGSIPNDGEVTPEMWFYMQEYRRYSSPKEAVRRKAEMRAQQRQNRLASQRWFGVSNLRPTANPIPYYGTYSPSWGGNGWNSYHWVGQSGGPAVIYHTARRGQ